MNAKEIYTALIVAHEMGLIEINHKGMLEQLIGRGELLAIHSDNDGVPIWWAIAGLVADRLDNPADARAYIGQLKKAGIWDKLIGLSMPEYPKHKLEAIQWADKLIDDGDFVILDTETTGLNGYPVQVAVIDHTGKVLFDTLVRPPAGVPIDDKAAAVHGITLDMVAESPEWNQVYDKFLGAVRDKHLVIYNAKFDVGVLNRAHRRYHLWWGAGGGYPWTALDCCMERYAEYNGNWNDWHQSYTWVKLTEAAAAMGVEVDNAHSALGDCQMTLGVIKALATKARSGKALNGDDIPL